MGSAEKFCLRWNDFERNISLAFRDIREEKDFFDCTISCGSRQIDAHKLILSACSPFFRTVLKQNPHEHPLLYLKGVQFNDLQAVLNFMYHGEVNVAQEELNSFLSVAEDLQVKGLTQDNSSSGGTSRHKKAHQERPRNLQQHYTNSSHTNPLASQETPYQVGDIEEIKIPEIKKEPYTATQQAYISLDPLTTSQHMDIVTKQVVNPDTAMQMATTDESYVEEENDFDYRQYDAQEEGVASYQIQGMDPNQGGSYTNSRDVEILSNIVENPEGHGYSCGLCGKNFGFEKGHCKRHIRNVHSKTVTNLACDYCQKSYKNYDSLRHHQRTTHNVYKQ